MILTAEKISELVDGEIIGNPNTKVKNVSKIEDAKNGDISFLANPKYTEFIYSTNASIIIVSNMFFSDRKINKTLIKVKDPYFSFSKIIEMYSNKSLEKNGISKNSKISENSKISKNVYIGDFTFIGKNVRISKNVKIFPNCFIGENVNIGENTILYPGVKIYHDCNIGKNNIIHSGVVIGADGFGFAANKSTNYTKIKQVGNVITESDVEIGANTTVDRATMGSTIIRKGVKLDNLIQIGHNVEIDENTVIAAQTAIAGSSKIGKRCMIGGQTAINGHIKIADDVKIAGQSGIASSITKNGEIVQGPMAFNIKKFQRSYVIFKKLPELYKRIESLYKSVNKR